MSNRKKINKFLNKINRLDSKIKSTYYKEFILNLIIEIKSEYSENPKNDFIYQVKDAVVSLKYLINEIKQQNEICEDLKIIQDILVYLIRIYNYIR